MRISDWSSDVCSSDLWCAAASGVAAKRQRRQRVDDTFGHDMDDWNEELVLQRYELLFEAGLVPEAPRRSGAAPDVALPGQDMHTDHTRILATATARPRARSTTRPGCVK